MVINVRIIRGNEVEEEQVPANGPGEWMAGWTIVLEMEKYFIAGWIKSGNPARIFYLLEPLPTTDAHMPYREPRKEASVQ